MNVKQLKSFLKSSPKESGLTASFSHIAPGWGFKYYSSRRVRDNCYDLQSSLALHDVCPGVGGKVNLDDCQYGYITKTVKIAGIFAAESLGIRPTIGMRQTEVYRWVDEHLKSEAEDLCNRYEDAAGYLNIRIDCCDIIPDFHCWNWGLDETGKAYLIDLDSVN